jgi:hypothetical protein
MSYLAKEERSQLNELPVDRRNAVLAERFRRECELPDAAFTHPGHVFVPGRPQAAFDFASAREFDLIEARIERETAPPARIVQLIAPAVPMRVSHLRPLGAGRVELDRQTPVLALALRADGTISAITEHDVKVTGALAEHYPFAEIETGRAYYLDDDSGEATPTVHDTAAEEMAEIAGTHHTVQRALAPVKKAAGAK